VNQEGTANHAKIWGLAFVLAIPAAFLFRFVINFAFRMLPHDLVTVIFGYWFIIRWVIFGGLMAAIAGILYAQGAFRSGGTVPTSVSLAGAPPGDGLRGLVGAEGGSAVFPVEMIVDRRHCVGDLYVQSAGLMFVSMRDQNIFKANTGRAVGSQFGLLGVLVGAAFSSVGSGKREEEIAAARATVDALPEDRRASLSPFSFSIAPNEIHLVKASGWKGTFIETASKKYMFHQAMMPAEVKAELQQWCALHSVASEGLD